MTGGRRGTATDVTDDPVDWTALRPAVEKNAAQGFTDEDATRYEVIAGALGPLAFPVTREQLLARLRERDAPENVLVDVRSLPDDARYGSAGDLLLALGIGTAGRIDVPGAPPRDPEGGAPALADEA